MRYMTGMCALALLAAAVPAAADLTLARDGKSDYVIVLAEAATAAERTAAQELQSHLEAVTGARLPVHEDANAPAGDRHIVVGPGRRLRAAAPDVDTTALGRDGIVLRTAGQTLYLAGGRPRGTLYAVYTFLEDAVGCRWWTATESYLPSRPTLTVPALDKMYVPQLQYRNPWYLEAGGDRIFNARLKCNGRKNATAAYGGHYAWLGRAHRSQASRPSGGTDPVGPQNGRAKGPAGPGQAEGTPRASAAHPNGAADGLRGHRGSPSGRRGAPGPCRTAQPPTPAQKALRRPARTARPGSGRFFASLEWSKRTSACMVRPAADCRRQTDLQTGCMHLRRPPRVRVVESRTWLQVPGVRSGCSATWSSPRTLLYSRAKASLNIHMARSS